MGIQKSKADEATERATTRWGGFTGQIIACIVVAIALTIIVTFASRYLAG